MDVSRRKSRPLATLLPVLLAFAALIALAHLLDKAAFHFMLSPDVTKTEMRDFYRMFRVMGHLPTWLFVAAALLLALPPRGDLGRRLRPALAVALSTSLAGGLAELLKLVVARERPGPGGEYIFRGLFSGFTDGSRLGMPSSHAAVAFGAAFALTALYPRIWPVVFVLATGCAATRLIAGAHFLSDCAVASFIGWLSARLITAIIMPKRSPY